jgi:hypothetical protein
MSSNDAALAAYLDESAFSHILPMFGKVTKTLVACPFCVAFSANKPAIGAEWKYYGKHVQVIAGKRETTACFCDAESVRRTPPGTIEVSTKFTHETSLLDVKKITRSQIVIRNLIIAGANGTA